uniref:Kinesin motor domain-containing protein n=1 Tax=Clytia hemisphaerica TaxID=252671 RepID=A0A7M5X8X7_9CNID
VETFELQHVYDNPMTRDTSSSKLIPKIEEIDDTEQQGQEMKEKEEEEDFKFEEPEAFGEKSDAEKPVEEGEEGGTQELQLIEEAILAPPQASGEHLAYIPMDYAKECIQKVIEDMKKMKANHFEVVEKIQQQYQLIEEESQVQFNNYVIKLRGEYSTKVATFRHVLESHQADYKQKQNFYEQAIKSLRDKNRALLIEKRNYLLKTKDQNAKNEKEKNQILSDLTQMLDQKHKEYVALRQRLIDERTDREQVEAENTELRNHLNELNSKLTHSSGDNKHLIEELNTLKENHHKLTVEHEELENEKSSVVKEKDELFESSTKSIEELNTNIEELKLKIKELEERPPVEVIKEVQVQRDASIATEDNVVAVAQPVAILQEDSSPKVDPSELEDLREQIQRKQNTIDGLRSDNEEKEKDWKKKCEELEIAMKELRNEKNILNMEVINVQEKNNILHKRLETMLNEVMDSVNTDETADKLSELNTRKESLTTDIEKLEKEIKEWEESFKEEHGREPKEDDRDENVIALHEKLRKKREEMRMVERDITVLSMLIDGTLPDDMKQQDDGMTVVSDTSDEFRKQFEVQKAELEEDIAKYKERIEEQEIEIQKLKDDIVELEAREPSERVVEKVVEKSVEGESSEDNSEAIAKLQEELTEAIERAEELEKEHETELESQRKHAHKLDKKLTKSQRNLEEAENKKRELESQLKIAKESAEADSNSKQEKIDQLQKELDKLNEEKIAKFPVKAKTEIKALQEKLKQLEGQQDGSSQELLDLKTKNSELIEQVNNLSIDVEKLKAKETELQNLQEIEKKYKELKKKYKALEAKKVVAKPVPAASSKSADPAEIKKLEKKIVELEKQLERATALDDKPKKDSKAGDSKVDPKAFNKLEKSNELLKEKVESLKNAAKADADKIKELQEKVKEAKSKGDEKSAKKQEKALKDLQKKLESEEKKNNKNKEGWDKAKEEIKDLNKEIDDLKSDLKKDKAELAKLSVAAKEGLEAMEKVDELKKRDKDLTEENKNLAENFNSERILRKKYYNMVEDMKGKIRVYARARPLSRSELDRGNHSIISSPDEYSLIIQTARGPKDFQYDAVFTPDHNQEKVFEDTNNLIQSAVDGYNVCIFAYGQTGSGKTFTMIGDKEQKFPGIAPRSFQAIYSLIDENKGKFSFKTSMYMMELYRDNLIDLFADAKNPAKLDIKKDKKGMVVVTGALVKEASNAEELMTLFEEGSSSRHIASTKMNAESSRSHLVLSIVIESTNLTSGVVVKGKLSLVDLAGSERANKTGATAEQLKEAQSINKSLSALGDVISALSSEQSFIPYRNNKLTMLMQDSLGGNAKTLMFVNISPADYNADETITSLTYASRVKLITNDASKNSDNKEIARLKGIIAKMKKGESVDDDDV